MHFTIRFRLAETSNKYPYFGVFCRSANTRSLDQSISQPLMTRFNDCPSKTTYTDISKSGAEPVTYVTGVRDKSLWRGRRAESSKHRCKRKTPQVGDTRRGLHRTPQPIGGAPGPGSADSPLRCRRSSRIQRDELSARRPTQQCPALPLARPLARFERPCL